MSFLDALFRAQPATALVTTGGLVDVSASDPPAAGYVLQAVDDEHAIWVPATGVDSVARASAAAALAAANSAKLNGGQPLWASPASAHADDEEFNGTPSTTWLYRGTASDHTTVQTLSVTASGVDPYAAQTEGTAHVDWGVRRASWMQFQPQVANGGGGSGYSVYAKKASVAIGTNCFIWGRLGTHTRVNSDEDLAAMWMVLIANEVSSGPDPLNYVSCGMATLGTGARSLFGTKRVAGSLTNLPGSVGAGVQNANGQLPYFAVHKIGTTIHFWAFDENLSRVHLGSTTYSGTLAWMGFLASGDMNSDPASTVHAADFLRRQDIAGFPLF